MSTAEHVPPSARHYLYVLRLIARLHDPAAWTSAEHASVARHFEWLSQATKQGRVVLAGRTDEPLQQAFGLVVFEAEDESAAHAFMSADPAIMEGVMTATLHPYALALLRR